MTSILIAAAISGIVSGADAKPTHPTSVEGAGIAQPLTDAGSPPPKHDCKGKNACKGQGGCKTDKHECKGKNACKGQGGCHM